MNLFFWATHVPMGIVEMIETLANGRFHFDYFGVGDLAATHPALGRVITLRWRYSSVLGLREPSVTYVLRILRQVRNMKSTLEAGYHTKHSKQWYLT